jgi:transforming growth factor-beta-induced protein
MKRRLVSAQSLGVLLVSLLLVWACDRDIQPQTSQPSGARIRINQSITEVVVNSPNFTLLKAAVVKAGLADALATGNLTVFAPTDAAFKAAGLATADAINRVEVGALRNILLYHVIGTERFFEDRIPEQLSGFTTLQGSQLYPARKGGLSVNGVPVSQADLEANNGVIHVIDQVLMPPAGNTIEVAVSNPNLTFLVAALQRASQGEVNLIQALATGTFTVFAPTDDAFKAAGFPTIESVRAVAPNVLSGILRYHVVGDRRFTTQLSGGMLTTLQGGKLSTTTVPGRTIVQGLGNSKPSTVIIPNIATLSGAVHVIDQVLLPGSDAATKTVTGIVVDNPAFSLLKAAVVRAGLADALATGSLTVFAPTDDAFKAAGFDADAISKVDINALRNILLYHVIGGNQFTTDYFSDRLDGFTTLQGQQVRPTNRQSVSVNGALVLQANIKATNGIIHVIDRVLLPPAGNLVEVAAGNPNFTYLVAAVQRAGLVQALATGSFTVFAPTNAAFQAAGFASIDAVKAADPATLARILTYHVVADRAFSSTLRNGELTTLQGGKAMVMVGPQGVTVKGNGNATPAKVVSADILAINGVIHVIDQVLLP